QVIHRHTEIAGAQGAVDQISAVERAWVGAPNELKNVLEYEDQSECQQQLETLITIIDRAQNAFDRRTDKAEQNSRNDESRKNYQRRDTKVGCIANEADPEIGPKRIERTTGKIDDLLNTKH